MTNACINQATVSYLCASCNNWGLCAYTRPAGAIYATNSNVSIGGYTSFSGNTVEGEARQCR